jgi:hypothetical protein
MILGFENFTVTVEQPTLRKVAMLGYLTIPERHFALSYLRKVRRVRKADTSATIYQARKLIAKIVGTSITTKIAASGAAVIGLVWLTSILDAAKPEVPPWRPRSNLLEVQSTPMKATIPRDWIDNFAKGNR